MRARWRSARRRRGSSRWRWARWRWLRPYRRHLAALVALQVAQTAAGLALPGLTANVIDDGALTGDTGHIVATGAVMLGVAGLDLAAALGAYALAAVVAVAVARDLRASLYERVLSRPPAVVARIGVASLLTRGTGDVILVQGALRLGLVLLVPAPVLALGAAGLAVRTDPVSAVVVLVGALPLGLTLVRVVRRLRPLARRTQGAVDEVARVLREQLAGARVIRTLGRQPYEQERFARASADQRDVATATARRLALLGPVLTLAIALVSAAVLATGAARVASGALGVGDLIAVVAYLTQILVSALMTTVLVLALPRAGAAADRIEEVLALTAPADQPLDPECAPRGVGSARDSGGAGSSEPRGAGSGARAGSGPGSAGVELRGAGVRRPGASAPVLYPVDLTVHPGQSLTLVGASGSGKSTVLGLLAGLIGPDTGQVRVAGHDPRRLAPTVRPDLVGLVPQPPAVFAGTVASNLRLARPDATEDQLWQALAAAQALDFVTTLAAAVGPGGANLSGGQRQRLAVARVLLQRPAVYLLDDPTSALDPATEAALLAALADGAAGAVVVRATQRLATLDPYDRVVVLDAGRVAGAGTPVELAGTCPVYRELLAAASVAG